MLSCICHYILRLGRPYINKVLFGPGRPIEGYRTNNGPSSVTACFERAAQFIEQNLVNNQSTKGSQLQLESITFVWLYIPQVRGR